MGDLCGQVLQDGLQSLQINQHACPNVLRWRRGRRERGEGEEREE